MNSRPMRLPSRPLYSLATACVALAVAFGAAAAPPKSASVDAPEADVEPPPSAKPDEGARREVLFSEATALSEQGRWREAADKIRQVLAMRSSPKALVALGYALINLDRLIEARMTLLRARAEAAAAEHRAALTLADAALARLETLTPRVTFRPRDDAPVTAVEVDGHPAELLGGEVAIDPGEHRLVVHAGEGAWETLITLQRGERVTVDATTLRPLNEPTPRAVSAPVTETPAESAAPAAAAVPASPPAVVEPTAAFPWGPTLLGAVGLLAAGTGTYLYFGGRADHAAAVGACGPTKDCRSDAWNPAFDDAAGKMLTGDVLLGVGGALVAGGALWWLIAGEPEDRGTEPSATLQVAPIEGGAYGGVRGRF